MATEIVNWEEQLKTEARDVAALERPKIGKISLRAGQMNYEGTPVPGNTITVIVLAHAVEHAYYTRAFDPNNLVNPDCFALSVTGQNMVPHPLAASLQAETCATCPQFEWGSDPKGGRGKACKEGRRLVVMAAREDMTAEYVASTELGFMKVPVTSIKNWANYVNIVSSLYQRPPWAVATKISVVPDARTQFKVNFEPAGVIDAAVLSALASRKEAAQAIALQPWEPVNEEEEKKELPATAKFSKRK